MYENKADKKSLLLLLELKEKKEKICKSCGHSFETKSSIREICKRCYNQYQLLIDSVKKYGKKILQYNFYVIDLE